MVEYIEYTSRKQLFLFDSYGFTGLKAFIGQDDSDIIHRILCDTKKINKDDNIVTLITLTFLKGKYKKLSKNEISKLSAMAADIFNLIKEFAELNNVKNEVIINFVDNQLQNVTSDTCGIFQLYFYKNLFDPLKKSGTINGNKLTKNTILKLLNELFSTSDEKNEQIIEQFAKKYEIRRE